MVVVSVTLVLWLFLVFFVAVAEVVFVTTQAKHRVLHVRVCSTECVVLIHVFFLSLLSFCIRVFFDFVFAVKVVEAYMADAKIIKTSQSSQFDGFSYR